jgi:hypothetical protein
MLTEHTSQTYRRTETNILHSHVAEGIVNSDCFHIFTFYSRALHPCDVMFTVQVATLLLHCKPKSPPFQDSR